MIKIYFIFLLVLLAFLALLAGCAPNLYTQGRGMAERGEYGRAVDLYREEIRNNPKSAEAWRELGVALYKQGELAKAEDALKQANNIKPDARANLYLGLIYEKQEMYDKALDVYRVSLSLKPKRSVSS